MLIKNLRNAKKNMYGKNVEHVFKEMLNFYLKNDKHVLEI